MKNAQLITLFAAIIGVAGCGHHYWTLQEKEAWEFPNNNLLSERSADETTLAYREFRDSAEQSIVKGTFRAGGTEKVAAFGALGTSKTGISPSTAGLMLLSSVLNDMSIEAQQARKLSQTHAQALIGDIGYYRSLDKSTSWDQASIEFTRSRDSLLSLFSQCQVTFVSPELGYAKASVRIRTGEFRWYRYKCVDQVNVTVEFDFILAKVESSKYSFELEISPVIDYHKKPDEVGLYIERIDQVVVPMLDSKWVKVHSQSVIKPGDTTPLEKITADFRFYLLADK